MADGLLGQTVSFAESSVPNHDGDVGAWPYEAVRLARRDAVRNALMEQQVRVLRPLYSASARNLPCQLFEAHNHAGVCC